MKTVAPEDLAEWKRHPVTEVLFQHLRGIREQHSRYLENGGTLKGGSATGEETGKVVGILFGIDLTLEVKADEGRGNTGGKG